MRLGWPIWVLARGSTPPFLFPAEIAADGGVDIEKRIALEMEEEFELTPDIVGEFWWDADGVPRIAYRLCMDCIPRPVLPLSTWLSAIVARLQKAEPQQ